MRVRIYKPAKTAMQSGRGNTKAWVLEPEPDGAREADPLMGWIGSADTNRQVVLHFASQEEAIAHAKKRGLDYVLLSPHESKLRPKSYADNFRYDRVRGA